MAGFLTEVRWSASFCILGLSETLGRFEHPLGYSSDVSILGIAKPPVLYWEFVGWETGIEPATFGATDRRSTS
jgi:hypothetical protein